LKNRLWRTVSGGHRRYVLLKNVAGGAGGQAAGARFQAAASAVSAVSAGTLNFFLIDAMPSSCAGGVHVPY
jgi:hypothetical protein